MDMFFLEILQVTLLCQNEIIFFAQQKILFHLVYSRKKYSLHWLNFMLVITNKSLKLRNMVLLNGAFQKSKNPLWFSQH